MSAIVGMLKNMFYNGLEYYNRFYSEYRGFVVDNEDPDKQGRLRLVVPGVIDDPTDYWAPSIGTFSGKGYGSHVIPRINDLVWVVFELGDPNKPIWKHGYFGKGDIPTDLTDLNNFWFRTPEGHLIEMDDTNEEVRVTDKSGNQIVINSKGISIIPTSNTKIYLGDKDKASEPGVLGDTLEKVLIPLMQNYMSMGSAVAGLATDVGNKMNELTQGVISNQYTAQLVTTMQVKGGEMKASSTQTMESINTLNESTSSLINQVPSIKSKKVKLD